MKKHLLFALLGAAFGAVSAPASAETMELKFGHVGAPGSLFAISAEEFAKRANAKLGGKAKVVVFGSSQLGTVDFALPSTVMSSVVDVFGLFEMPYLIKDRAHMMRVEKEIVWPKLVPAVEKKGYKVIAVWENGFRQITNNKHPIVKPADLQGIKLRTPKGEWRLKMFKAYGANPTPMALSEVFAALQTGTIDGQENPYAQIYASKFQEVQKYLSVTNHVYTPAYVTVGAERWAKLPADVRKVLEDTARETQGFVYETAARLDKELLGKIKAGGVAVNEADQAAFAAASKGIYDEFSTTVPGGKELVEKAQALRN